MHAISVYIIYNSAVSESLYVGMARTHASRNTFCIHTDWLYIPTHLHNNIIIRRDINIVVL